MEDIYIALGKLTVNFTRLELLVSQVYNQIKDSKKDGIDFIKKNGIPKTILKLKYYTRKNITSTKLKNQILYLLERVDEVREKRNNLLHSVYFKESKTGQVVQFDLLATVNSETYITSHISKDIIDTISEECIELIKILFIIILNIEKDLKEKGNC